MYWVGVALGFIFSITSAICNVVVVHLLEEGGFDWRHIICYYSFGIIITTIALSLVMEDSNRLLSFDIKKISQESWMTLAVMVSLMTAKSGNKIVIMCKVT